jgi:integrase
MLDKITDRKAETILTSASGRPFKPDHFKHQFKDASRKAGLPDDLVFHGLRKTAAVRLAESGCSTEQIKSITGHRTDSMAAYYARQADQRVLARAAMGKFEGQVSNQNPKNCPTDDDKVYYPDPPF